MKQSEYVRSVSPFIDYLAGIWLSGFSHSYLIRMRQWKEHNRSDQWSCESLCDARNQYWWHGTYSKAKSKLGLYKSAWLKAVARGDNVRAKAVVQCVFRWGGVLYQGENRVSVRNHPDFIQWMNQAKHQLLCGDDTVPNFRKAGGYKMNSAYTKAYAVMDDRLIIYDGRVGAALGLLACRYLSGLSSTSSSTSATVDFSLIKFPWGSERKSGERYVSAASSERNPSTASYSFPQLRNDNRQHAIWAVRASWLVEALGRKIRETIDPSVTNRDIEAALFMVGYRVN